MYLYTLKQPNWCGCLSTRVVNRFKKNVSLHVETTKPLVTSIPSSLWIALKKMYLYTLKQHFSNHCCGFTVVNRFKKNVSLHVETTSGDVRSARNLLWIALKKMYLYTLKQLCNLTGYNHHVVNRFKKNVSLHVETTNRWSKLWCKVLWIALKKMYLYTLKQRLNNFKYANLVVNRFKKNVSLHVETTRET